MSSFQSKPGNVKNLGSLVSRAKLTGGGRRDIANPAVEI